MRITWLADVLRTAGLEVVEHAGWQTRERPGDWSPRFIVAHATAAPSGQADDTQVRIVRDGRADLHGPIANACIDRSGRWHVLAAGRCNTTITGTAGPFEGQGNTHALGIEACNDNASEPWPAVQYQAYATGVAAICRRMGWPESRVVGHREHTPGHKTDPTFGMNAFRALVRERIEDGDDMPSAEEIAAAVWAHKLSNGSSAGGVSVTLDARTNATTNDQLPAVLAAVGQDKLTAAVRAALPTGVVTVTDEQLTAAILAALRQLAASGA